MWLGYFVLAAIWVWIVVAWIVALGIGASGGVEWWQDRRWRR